MHIVGGVWNELLCMYNVNQMLIYDTYEGVRLSIRRWKGLDALNGWQFTRTKVSAQKYLSLAYAKQYHEQRSDHCRSCYQYIVGGGNCDHQQVHHRSGSIPLHGVLVVFALSVYLHWNTGVAGHGRIQLQARTFVWNLACRCWKLVVCWIHELKSLV